MAFGDFKYPDVVKRLGLKETGELDLHAAIEPLPLRDAARLSLAEGAMLGASAHSEAARRTWMVGPVLQDVWSRYRGKRCLNAEVEFAPDPDAGLSGMCDFAFSLGPQRQVMGLPVLLLFEAKRDSIPDGLGQAIAAMEGARRHNLREGAPTDEVHGCVTTGSAWRFLRLRGAELTVDQREYSIVEADKLVGIMVNLLGPPQA